MTDVFEAFSVVFVVWICIIIVGQIVGLEGLTSNQRRLFVQFPCFLTIFLMYTFGVRLREFNWNIRAIDIVIVLIIFILIEFYPIFY